MNTKILVDPELPVRDWLRQQNVTGVEERVFIGLPTDATYPAISFGIIDGGVQPGEAPLANVLISFSVWAPDRTDAQAGAWSLVSILESIRYVTLDDTLVCLGAQVVTGPTARPEPDGFHRYVIDAALLVRTPS